LQLTFGLAILALAAIVQSTALNQLFEGPRPDLVLVLVLAWSMVRGLAEGTVGGIAGGLALDLLSAAPFGLHTALLGCIGSLTALGEANLFRGNLPIFVTAAALATVMLHGGALLFLQAAGQQTFPLARFVQFIVPTAALNALLMPLAFSLVQRGVRALSGWRQLEL
jgi:rod shape-determining protein MreD